jgi:hypothetical protein
LSSRNASDQPTIRVPTMKTTVKINRWRRFWWYHAGSEFRSLYALKPAQPFVCWACRQLLSETLTFQPIRP